MRSLGNGRGYTIIELMIVIVVIGILVSVAIPNYTAVLSRARKSACLATQRTIELARMLNFVDNGSYGFGMSDLTGTFDVIGFIGDSTMEDLICQEGGTYEFLVGSFEIRCSIESHN